MSMFRCVKTTAEIREGKYFAEYVGVLDVQKAVAKVNRLTSRVHGLPTAWDDEWPSVCGIRNWKRYRRTQFRPRRMD